MRARMSDIEISPYHVTDELAATERNPLFIGCSGGGGHNSAMDAIIKYLIENKLVTKEKLVSYEPRLYEEVSHEPTIIEAKYHAHHKLKGLPNSKKNQIYLGSRVTHDIPVLSRGVKWGLKRTAYPVLPNRKDLGEEIQKVNNSQLTPDKKSKKTRYYIDMLLDVYQMGYESVAIWNLLQKADKTEELKKLIQLQSMNDEQNYQEVKSYFVKLLSKQAKTGKPYTEIISTQAMSLPALCDAVAEYNKQHGANIKIRQYATDFLTPGAVHFFNPLSALTREQASQMYLYGVNLKEGMADHFGLKDRNFAGIFCIDPKNNSMVRPGFKDPKLKEISSDKPIDLAVQVNNSPNSVFHVEAGESIASIMLGSLASNDTVEYVKKLVESNHYKKIFIFGGNAPHIAPLIKKINDELDSDGPMIIQLDNQDDIHMAPILKRSNLVILRGGGLSMMEAMAITYEIWQTILIHCKEDLYKILTSGISWEDGNVDEAIDYHNDNHVVFRRTSINLISEQIERLKRNYSLDERCGVLSELLDYFRLLLERDRECFEKRIGSFREIVEAISNGNKNITTLIKETSHHFKTGLVTNNYSRLLKKLNAELATIGIKALQSNVEILGLANFTHEYASHVQLIAFSETVTSEHLGEIEISYKKQSLYDILVNKINDTINSLSPLILEAEKSSIDQNTTDSGYISRARNLLGLYSDKPRPISKHAAAELKEKLEDILEIQLSNQLSTEDKAESLAQLYLIELLDARNNSSQLMNRLVNDELSIVIKDTILWIEKHYPNIYQDQIENMKYTDSGCELTTFKRK